MPHKTNKWGSVQDEKDKNIFSLNRRKGRPEIAYQQEEERQVTICFITYNNF